MTGDAVVVDGVSRWFRDRVAVADVSFAAGPGVTGLLGHNGAGKTTVLRLLAGFTSPSRGSVRILGSDPRLEPEVFRRVGLVPDGDGLWPFLTAHGAVALLARLRGVADPDAAAHRALQTVGLDEVADRRLAGFSKGMRQGVKLAQALAHDPDVLLLDEPLNGLDPARRRAFVELVQRLGDEGKTVIVSSHVLHEVERMAPRVVVLVNGRLVAEGETASIRALIADRPRSVRVEAGTGTRELAQALVGAGLADAVRLQDGGALLETPDPDALARELPVIARDRSITVSRVEPVGDDLESVYAYLHARARGAAR
jgi:ABC-2 type transport system ATP-binding protein